MVVLALPLLLITTDFANEFPKTTLPKFMEAGLRDNNNEGGTVATAARLMEVGEIVASLTMLKLPERAPAL